MKLVLAGYGLAVVAGTATLAIVLTLRSLDAKPPARRNALAERLEPIAEDDASWLGAYRLCTGGDALVIESDGVLRGTSSGCNCDPDYHCFYGHLPRARNLEARGLDRALADRKSVV